MPLTACSMSSVNADSHRAIFGRGLLQLDICTVHSKGKGLLQSTLLDCLCIILFSKHSHCGYWWAPHPSLFGFGHCRGILPSRAAGPAGSTAVERVEAGTTQLPRTRGAPQSSRRGTAS